MSRLLRLLREVAAEFTAARVVAQAAEQHRRPSRAALARLGIASADYARIRR